MRTSNLYPVFDTALLMRLFIGKDSVLMPDKEYFSALRDNYLSFDPSFNDLRRAHPEKPGFLDQIFFNYNGRYSLYELTEGDEAFRIKLSTEYDDPAGLGVRKSNNEDGRLLMEISGFTEEEKHNPDGDGSGFFGGTYEIRFDRKGENNPEHDAAFTVWKIVPEGSPVKLDDEDVRALKGQIQMHQRQVYDYD